MGNVLGDQTGLVGHDIPWLINICVECLMLRGFAGFLNFKDITQNKPLESL
jgi:hypothetical protein